jgi:hypothetical protein
VLLFYVSLAVKPLFRGSNPKPQTGLIKGLANNGFELCWRSSPGIAQIDLMMLAPQPVSLLGDEPVDPFNGWTLIGIWAKVQNLCCLTLVKRFKSHAR